MNKNNIMNTPAALAAIERWENEGGRSRIPGPAQDASADNAGAPAHAEPGNAQHSEPESSLKDRVCGRTVTAESAHRHEHEGRPYYFCSESCRAAFVADPAGFVAAAKEAPTSTEGGS